MLHGRVVSHEEARRQLFEAWRHGSAGPTRPWRTGGGQVPPPGSAAAPPANRHGAPGRPASAPAAIS